MKYWFLAVALIYCSEGFSADASAAPLAKRFYEPIRLEKDIRCSEAAKFFGFPLAPSPE